MTDREFRDSESDKLLETLIRRAEDEEFVLLVEVEVEDKREGGSSGGGSAG